MSTNTYNKTNKHEPHQSIPFTPPRATPTLSIYTPTGFRSKQSHSASITRRAINIPISHVPPRPLAIVAPYFLPCATTSVTVKARRVSSFIATLADRLAATSTAAAAAAATIASLADGHFGCWVCWGRGAGLIFDHVGEGGVWPLPYENKD